MAEPSLSIAEPTEWAYFVLDDQCGSSKRVLSVAWDSFLPLKAAAIIEESDRAGACVESMLSVMDSGSVRARCGEVRSAECT